MGILRYLRFLLFRQTTTMKTNLPAADWIKPRDGRKTQ